MENRIQVKGRLHVLPDDLETAEQWYIEDALTTGFVTGSAKVQRFDGRGPIEVFYATFTTKTAGMPFMATVIAPLSQG